MPVTLKSLHEASYRQQQGSGTMRSRSTSNPGAPHTASKYSQRNATGEEYGFFQDLEPTMSDSFTDATSDPQDSMPRSGYISNGSLSSNEQQATSVCRSSSVATIFEVEGIKAPVSCRSFSDNFQGSLSSLNIPVSAGIDGFRIVQNKTFGMEYVEYKVTLWIDGKAVVNWRNYKDFKDLASACQMFSDVPFYSNDHFGTLENTISAWKAVVDHRPKWFQSRTLSIDFISSEIVLLKAFIKNLLFDTPCVQLLLEFLS